MAKNRGIENPKRLNRKVSFHTLRLVIRKDSSIWKYIVF